jgi:hypothetical protein
MAAREESPPCCLSQLPYELLKSILAEVSASINSRPPTDQIVQLDPHDQISVWKTCIRLWQLAYPMAYNRITVTIGPEYKESEWQHLASGVGLRYVQHLEIRSLFGAGKKSKNIEDLVAGTLIAALRRNQLLSFGHVRCPMARGPADRVTTLPHSPRQSALYLLRLSSFS